MSPGDGRVARLEAAGRLLGDLHTSGWPCPRPIPRRDGRFVSLLEDSIAQVATFVSGAADWSRIDSARVSQVGERLAEFHAFQEGRPLPDLPDPDFLGMTMHGLSKRERELSAAGFGLPWTSLLAQARDDAASLLPRLKDLPCGLCHLDFSPGNVLFENDRLVSVIDFELYPAPLVMDLAFALVYWAFPFDRAGSTASFDSGLAASLIGAYRRVRPLTPPERSLFRDALIACAVRWWSRQAPQQPGDPLWRLTSRGQVYRLCRDLALAPLLA